MTCPLVFFVALRMKSRILNLIPLVWGTFAYLSSRVCHSCFPVFALSQSSKISSVRVQHSPLCLSLRHAVALSLRPSSPLLCLADFPLFLKSQLRVPSQGALGLGYSRVPFFVPFCNTS
jgi:hypothetical protein